LGRRENTCGGRGRCQTGRNREGRIQFRRGAKKEKKRLVCRGGLVGAKLFRRLEKQKKSLTEKGNAKKVSRARREIGVPPPGRRGMGKNEKGRSRANGSAGRRKQGERRLSQKRSAKFFLQKRGGGMKGGGGNKKPLQSGRKLRQRFCQ